MINKYHFILAIIVGIGSFLFSVPFAAAECSRNDIDYFLEKGFSTDQITAICEAAKPRQFGDPTAQGAEDYEAYDKDLEARMRIERRLQKEEDDILLLKTAIAAEDIKVTSKWLDFKSPFCISAGSNPEVEARVKVCPLVLYRIYFKGLQVKEYERKYIAFGRREIEVEGTIKRKLLHDFKGYPVALGRKLLAAYKANIRRGGTYIPVRKDYPIRRVQEILRAYANSAEE